MAETFGKGTLPWWTNPERILEAKMLLAINGAGGGTGVGGGGAVYRGTGSPEGVITSAAAGALYYDVTTGALWEFGGTAGTNTGWSNIIAAQ